MKNYEVVINGSSPIRVQATRASVAVHRAMDHFKESMYTPCCEIHVRSLGTVRTEFRVRADVACDPPGSYKREVLSMGPFQTKTDAHHAAGLINQLANDAALMQQPVTTKRAQACTVEVK